MEQEHAQESSLRHYLKIVQKRIWLPIALFVLSVTGAAIVSYRTTPIYRATALLRVEKRRPNVVRIRDVYEDVNWPYGRDHYKTQYRLIRSRMICERVFNTLSLIKLPKYAHLRDPVGVFMGEVIVEPVSGTFLVEVSYESEDPERATRAANGVSDEYVSSVKRERTTVSEEAEGRITKQIPILRKKLTESQAVLWKFEEENSALSFSKRREIIYRILSALSTRLSNANQEIAALKARYQSVENAKKVQQLLALPSVVNSPAIQAYLRQKLALTAQKAELGHEYRPESEQIKSVESKIAVIEEEIQREASGIAESIRIRLEEKTKEKEELKILLDRQEALAESIDAKLSKYDSLVADVEGNRRLYDEFVHRQKEIQSSLQFDPGSVQIVDRAQVPISPVRPKKRQNIILTALMSLLAGIALTFLFEHFDDSIKGHEDIDRYVGLPLLGVVPSAKAGKKKALVDTDLLAHHKPKSNIAEAYRSIRTSLVYASPNQEAKAYVVTSAGPQEGKTTTAINLAVALAYAGKKVLLVDSDLRKPRIHKTFGLENGKGLTNCLVGQDSAQDLVRQTEVENLSVMLSGPIPPNPVELLDSPKMEVFVEEMKKSFDTVIFDSPPLVAVADGAVLAARTNGAIQVIWAGNTSYKIVRLGKEKIENIGAKIIGVVLNNVKVSRSGYYYYYPRYYKYYGKREEPTGE